MSSLADSVSPRVGPRSRVLERMQVSAGTALTWGVAIAIAAVSFGASGGLALERTTWTEVGLVLCGAALIAGALLTRAIAPPFYGGLTLLGLTALAAYTALSITWSLSPADSWLEASRTFAYVAAFAGALALVRLVPGRWAAVLSGIGLGCVLVCAWALATKVFPQALSPDETFARLREPFGYWNAVGLMAALGVPPLLWIAARRTGSPVVNALAWPGLGILFVCLMLSYSRGGLLALGVGLVFWFAVVPLRLRAVPPGLAAGVAAAPVVAWTFARDVLSTDEIPLVGRADAGHQLGALLLLMSALLLATGLATAFFVSQRPPAPRTRKLAGRVLVGGIAGVLVALLIAVATQPAASSATTALPGTNQVQSISECSAKITTSVASVSSPIRSGPNGSPRSPRRRPVARAAANSHAIAAKSDSPRPISPRSASVWIA